MATLSSAAAIAACDAIVDQVDAGNQAGRLIITTVDGGTGTTLIAFTLDGPAFGGATDAGSAATATAEGTPISASASGTGTAAGFALQSMNSGTPTTVISGSVAASGGDIDIDNTSITTGQTCNLTSLTVSVPEVT